MTITCSVCGRVSDPQADGDPPLTWSLDAGDRPSHVCPECTRTHVRAIEAKIDQQWW